MTLFQTLKYNVVSTLKSDVETTLKMGCFPNVESNNVASTLKNWLFNRRDLKSTLNNVETMLCADWVVIVSPSKL